MVKMEEKINNLINQIELSDSSRKALVEIFSYFQNEISRLSEENVQLKAENSKLKIENEKLRAENSKLMSENKELRRRLNMNSSNSSLPPSTDKFKSKKEKSSVSGRGGKKGHKGTTLKQISNPDEIKKILPESCICGSIDLVVTGRYDSRQEFGIQIKRKVIEYRLIECKCKTCGKFNKPKSELPSNTFYSQEVKAYAVYMIDRHFMAYGRLQELFKDMFNLPISEGSINNWRREFASILGVSYIERLKELLIKSKYINADETSMNVSGSKAWVHVACNEKYTALNASKSRGLIGIESGKILDRYKGFIIADGWSAYKGLGNKKGIQSCYAHLFRYCDDIYENYQQKWANNVKNFLYQFIEKAKIQNSRGIRRFPSQLRVKYNNEYDELIKEAKKELGKCDYDNGHNAWRFLRRLEKEKSSVMLFLKNTFLPLTNNEAERSLRALKIKQKISGTTISMKTLQENLDIRSFISTSKKQQQNVLNSIVNLFKNPLDFILN
jgi:transposase